MMFPVDTLKMSHDYIKIEFVWWGKVLSYYNSASSNPFNQCSETSIFIQHVIIGLVVSIVTLFQYKGLDVLFLRVTKFAVVKVSGVSTKEKYFIVGNGVAAHSGWFGREFKPPAYIHIHAWCVMDYSVQWDVEVYIFGITPFLGEQWCVAWKFYHWLG